MTSAKAASPIGTNRPVLLVGRSPARLALLAQLGITPQAMLSLPQEETDGAPNSAAGRGETPSRQALRRACARAQAGHKAAGEAAQNAAILAAATLVAVGRRILPPPQSEGEASLCLRLLSGRAHRVYTGLCVVARGQTRKTCVMTRVHWKRLHDSECRAYLASGQWRGAAGGYRLDGLAAGFVRQLVGSPSNVLGLPLYETRRLLMGA